MVLNLVENQEEKYSFECNYLELMNNQKIHKKINIKQNVYQSL